MKLIGVTGLSGSGKSDFCCELQKLFSDELLYIDIDDISKFHIQNETVSLEEKIAHFEKQFGIKIMPEDFGEYFRKGRQQADKLRDPLYLCIKKSIEEILATTNAQYVVLDWIWLPKTEFFDNCNIKVLMRAENDKLRIQKILERERPEIRTETKEQYLSRFELREKYSIDYNQYDYDVIIENDYSNLNCLKSSALDLKQSLKSTQLK